MSYLNTISITTIITILKSVSLILINHTSSSSHIHLGVLLYANSLCCDTDNNPIDDYSSTVKSRRQIFLSVNPYVHESSDIIVPKITRHAIEYISQAGRPDG